MLAAIAAVWLLSALMSFVPWLHAHGLYLRDAVRANGEWWRLVTAMWVHLDWRHWLADACAATGLLLLAGRAARVQAAMLVLVACGIAVQVALLRMPAIGWYGGLSGALHGLALWAALGLLRVQGLPRMAGVLLSLGVIVKVWLEQSCSRPWCSIPHGALAWSVPRMQPVPWRDSLAGCCRNGGGAGVHRPRTEAVFA